MTTSSQRDAAASAFVLLASTAIISGIYTITHRTLPVESEVRSSIPAAATLFEVKGGGFARGPGGGVFRGGHGGQIDATAPALASAPFELGPSAGGPRTTVSLVEAAGRPLTLEGGLAVYRDAYPAVDVVANPHGSDLELLYVVRALPPAPLRIRPTAGAGGSLRVEPTTHAVLALDDAGHARARVSPPVAIDAHGRVRTGEYALEDGALSVRMSWEGLAPPIVLDPMFTIPMWTILDDARVPGSFVYSPTSRSREVQIVQDAGRNRTVLIRPARAQQLEDRSHIAGSISRPGYDREAAQRISQAPLPPAPGVTVNAAAAADWARGYLLESETWEWDPQAARWQRNDAAALPGLIDPALAYDARRGLVVAYGGGSPALGCSRMYSTSSFFCANGDPGDRTYEYDGTSWTWREIASSPPPRLRAAMAFDAAMQRVVLFGGRTFGSLNPSFPVSVNGPPFPDNLAGDLRNDTWTYDGQAWTQLPTGNAPPAREGAQLVYDAGRSVLVLVGGTTASSVTPDALSIWEFDGTDWRERVVPGDPSLPRDLQTRSGAAAFYNPVRERVTIFGGASVTLDPCAMTSDQIAAAKAAAKGNADATAQLAATGCLGGYAHDLWEWDGTSFTRSTSTAYAATISGQAVFETVAGAMPWSSATAAGPESSGPGAPTSRLPWRYDSSPSHYPLRTALERAYLGDAGAGSPASAVAAAGDAGAPPAATSNAPLVSPAFVSSARPDVVFDPARALATIFTSDDGAAYELDGAKVTRASAPASPFAAGVNDFFAAAWDPGQQQVVLFDPRTATTWTSSGTGWTALAASSSPPALPLTARRVQDLRTQQDAPSTAVLRLAALSPSLPGATFDRIRGRMVMFYGGSLWELAGGTWLATPLPPSLTSCSAATLVGFDGARGRTVLVGCTVPGQTWEWDGAQFYGPFAGPYQEIFPRVPGPLATPVDAWTTLVPSWKGTMQLQHEHPNAIFESPSLGGVATFDGDGALRIWNGSSWQAGPALPGGNQCRIEEAASSYAAGIDSNYFIDNYPVNFYAITAFDAVPMCAFPPVVEDRARNRILAFRDGPRGMMELNAGATPATWHAAPLGVDGFDWTTQELFTASLLRVPLDSTTRVNPMPYELLTPEQITQQTLSDPASRQNLDGTPVQASTSLTERLAIQPWWPFRLFDDPVSGRIRVLTHRGVLWELGGEDLKGLGEPCSADADCGAGSCSTEGVCCDIKQCNSQVCMTCKGSNAGTCSPVASGRVDTLGRCGTGPCAGECPGIAYPSSCTFQAALPCGTPPTCSAGVLQPGGHCSPYGPTCLDVGAPVPSCQVTNGVASLTTACNLPPTPCAGGLGCASDGASCKAGCTTRTDCLSRYQTCSTTSAGCTADSVAQAAADAGVQPTTTLPPPMRPPAAIAGALLDAGFAPDDAGVFVFNTTPGYMVAFAYDPNRQSPQIQFRSCMDFLGSCALVNKAVDSCVAAASRCSTTTPWLGDPSGDDCCTEGCLLSYFNARQTMTEAQALMTVATSNCYAPPAADAGSDAAADAAAAIDGGTP